MGISKKHNVIIRIIRPVLDQYTCIAFNLYDYNQLCVQLTLLMKLSTNHEATWFKIDKWINEDRGMQCDNAEKKLRLINHIIKFLKKIIKGPDDMSLRALFLSIIVENTDLLFSKSLNLKSQYGQSVGSPCYSKGQVNFFSNAHALTKDMVTNAKFIGLYAHSLIEEVHRLESKCNFVWNNDLNEISNADIKRIISSISDRGPLNLLLREMRSGLYSFFDSSAQAASNIPSNQKLEAVSQRYNG